MTPDAFPLPLTHARLVVGHVAAETAASLPQPVLQYSAALPDQPAVPVDTVSGNSQTPENTFCSHYNLTARETEVMLLLLKGRNNPFIREALNISDNTLKSHLRNIYRKLIVTNRQELFSLFDVFDSGRRQSPTGGTSRRPEK